MAEWDRRLISKVQKNRHFSGILLVQLFFPTGTIFDDVITNKLSWSGVPAAPEDFSHVTQQRSFHHSYLCV